MRKTQTNPNRKPCATFATPGKAASGSLTATVALFRKVERQSKATLLLSLRTEMTVVRTLLFLVKQANNEKRFHHLKRARIALQEIHKLAAHVRPTRHDLIEIEDLREQLVSLSIASLPVLHD